MWEFLHLQFAHNQFLTGGAVIAIVGFAVAYLRNFPGHIYQWLRRRVVTEIDIPDRDESFKWLEIWLSNHPYQRRCRLWTVKTKRKRDSSESRRLDKPRIILSPAPGIHFLWYKKKLMILRRDRKDGGTGDNGSSPTLGFRETFNITLFSRRKEIVLALLDEARESAHPKEDFRITILRPDYGDWIVSCQKLPRPLDSVILAGSMAQDILSDVKYFLESEQWYQNLGIPYRRGYLLHGSPGNGKSSLVTAIASELHLDVCVLNLANRAMSDSKLAEAMGNVPDGAIILIEDIDCVFQERKKVDEQENVSFSGLLNTIDGVMAGEGRLLFLTTNHIEKLDAALIRPGRVDVKLEIQDATKEQVKALWLRFFPTLEKLGEEFAEKIISGTNMATIQGHLLKHRDNPAAALEGAIV